MYSSQTRAAARELLASGLGVSAASRTLGVSRSTVRQWRDHPDLGSASRKGGCPPCDGARVDRSAYALLLGFYLGDGCISVAPRCQILRVSCDAKFPGIIADVDDSIRMLRPEAVVHHTSAPGVTVVSSAWRHWTCLFPQHGSGPKHRRRLDLADWQAEIVTEHPAPFLQGLFHSDGCRTVNTVHAACTGKEYSYARWTFSNRSADIHAMCQRALDLAGVEWRSTGWHTDVSQRASVARLDSLVGLKA